MGDNRKTFIALLLSRTQKMMLFTVIIAMPLIVIAAPSASVETASEPVYLFKIVAKTTSHWTTMTMDGIEPFMENSSIIVGADIPGFWYDYANGCLSTAREPTEERPAVLEIFLLTFKGNESWQFIISKGDNGYVEVTIHQYSGGSWVQLASFINTGRNPEFPGINTRSFTINYDQMYVSPSGSATIDPVPSTLKKRVFAFYYQWYFTPYGPGREYFGTYGLRPHQSLLGLYDSMDERVIEAHIMMAKADGIDCFIAAWGGIGWSGWEKPLPALLRIAESLNFKIALYASFFNYTAGDVVKELSYIFRTYASHPAYLKVDGTPVIFVYCVNYNREPSFWTNVVRDLRAKVGPVYLIGDLRDSAYAEPFDGIHWYSEFNTSETSRLFDSYKNNMRLGLKDIDWNQAVDLIMQGRSLPLKERFLAFTVMPGFDKRYARAWSQGDLYLDRMSGQTYEDFWGIALSKDPDGVLITSWNEWYEGTEIEPSVEYGFAYFNLTRRFVSNYKGSSPSIYSTQLALLSDVDRVLRLGERNSSIRLINTSSNPATGVNLTLSLGEGLSLQHMERSRFYAYIEETSPRNYHVIIPFLKPNEVLTFNATILASPGTSKLKASAIGCSPSGVPSQAYFEKQVQIVSDRVVVNLSSTSSRVEVGSEAKIAVSARYEYDGQPLVGTTYLNDTLTKNSTGRCTYSARGVSDLLHRLTDFASDAVTVTFDRITTSDTVGTLAPGSITASTALTFESDGRPVDKATVTVDGAPIAETIPGTFQITVATWSPFYQLNVHIERPGFTPRNITLSGYAIGNIAVEATAAAVLLVVLILLIRRRGV